MSVDATDRLRISAKRTRKQKEGKLVNVDRLQCQFIIPRKNRQCPLTRKKDVLFCAEHLKINSDNDIKRIPCPVDPRHSIWENTLENHVEKCNKKKEKSKTEPWFELNKNCSNQETKELEFEINYKKWIPIVEESFKEYEELKLEILEHKGVEDRMNELSNQKHAIQQSSLISHLNNNKLLSNNFNYIEFGCGRAEFSRYTLKSIIHQDLKGTDFFLIDRSPSRMKLDSKMVQDAKESDLDVKIFRVKIDIKDLNADNIISNEFKNGKKFVAISKHLCGAATDLTIQCILRNEILKERFEGMIVAMCCRHCCDYNMLSEESKTYLLLRNIDEVGFKHLMKFASWAVNGRRDNLTEDDGTDHLSGLSLGERETLGLKARRLIDESRKFTLIQQGFKAELCQYINREISLENTCLIVHK